MPDKRKPPPAQRKLLSACCQQTVTIYRGGTAEGTVLRCLWCQREMVFHEGAWEMQAED
jgi:hypothetical protein